MTTETQLQDLIDQTQQLDASVRAEMVDMDNDVSKLRSRVTGLEVKLGLSNGNDSVAGGGESPTNPNAPVGNDIIQVDEDAEKIWVWNPETETWVDLPFTAIAPPSNIDVDDILAQADASVDAKLTERVDSLASSITESVVSSSQTQIDGLAQQITTVGTTASTNAAAIQSETNARIAAIQNEQTARADADSVFAQQLTDAIAQIDSNHAAFIAFQSTVSANPDEATATLLEAMQSEIDANKASITSESTTRASETSVLTSSVNTLNASLGSLSTDVANAQAAISGEVSARVTGEAALTSSTNALASRMGVAESAITTVENTTANLSAAQTSSTNTLQASINGLTSSVQTQSSAIAGIEAKRVLSVNNAGLVTGVELVSGGNVGSQIKFQTQNFIMADASSGNLTVPFSVTGGITKLNAAMIKTASIDTLQVAGNAITASYSASQTANTVLGYVAKSYAVAEGTTGYTKKVTLYVYNSFGEAVPAILQASGRHGTIMPRTGDGFAVWSWYVKQGGTVLAHSGATAGDHLVTARKVTLQPGANYFYLYVANLSGAENGYGGFSAGNLTLMAAAR